MPLSSKSSTSPSAVPQAHWGGALSVPTPPQAANRHHRSSSSASSTRIDPTLENGITAQADGRNGGNVEQHGTSSSSSSSTMVLASAPKTTSELAGAVQHGNTAEQMRCCRYPCKHSQHTPRSSIDRPSIFKMKSPCPSMPIMEMRNFIIRFLDLPIFHTCVHSNISQSKRDSHD